MKRLTMREVQVVDMYVVNHMPQHEIAKKYRLSRRRVGYILYEVAEKLEIQNLMLLGIYWCCPLFRSGLTHLGLLPRR